MSNQKPKPTPSLKDRGSALSPKAQVALYELLQSCPPTRVSRHLRHVLLDYISSHKNALPLDIDIYLYVFSCLFDFLDVLEDERINQTKKPLV